MLRYEITRFIIRVSWRRVRKGSRGWLLVWMSATVVELARKLLGEKEVRATLELHAGDAVEVRVQPPAR
jgi:hypothetical protein